MANDNFPRGLFPINFNPKADAHYYRVNTAGTDIFLGQPVDFLTTGFVDNAIPVGTDGVVRALGVAVGFAGPLKKGLATDDPFLDVSDLSTLATGLDTGDRWILVADNPMQQFAIQADTGGTLATLAAIGETAALIYRATSGNTSTGWANLELDASSNAASTGQLVRILGLQDIVNVDGTENSTGNYAKFVVMIQTHRKASVNVSSAV